MTKFSLAASMKGFLTVILSFCLISVSSAETITLVADLWPPFNGEPKSENEGYMVDIARTIFEEKGYHIEYLVVPWKRAVSDTRRGIYHGAIGASKTDAPGLIFPEQELARNYLAFYVKKGTTWRLAGGDSLQQVSLGVIDGYDYRTWLLSYIKENRTDQNRIQLLSGEAPLRRNLQKLMINRVDVVVGNEAAIRWEAKQLGILDAITPAGYGTEPAFCYIAFSPAHSNSSELAQVLSDGIRELRETGQLQKILDKYGITDWRRQADQHSEKTTSP